MALLTLLWSRQEPEYQLRYGGRLSCVVDQNEFTIPTENRLDLLAWENKAIGLEQTTYSRINLRMFPRECDRDVFALTTCSVS